MSCPFATTRGPARPDLRGFAPTWRSGWQSWTNLMAFVRRNIPCTRRVDGWPLRWPWLDVGAAMVVLVDLLISLAALGAVFGSASARVVKQYERGLVFRFGR